jgi:hypothetical protein
MRKIIHWKRIRIGSLWVFCVCVYIVFANLKANLEYDQNKKFFIIWIDYVDLL